MYPAMYRHPSASRFQGRGFQRPFPLVNIKSENQQVVLELMAPGRKKEDFKVEVKNNLLTISSEAVTQPDDSYRSAEFQLVPFKRSFRLVSDLDTENIQARYADGILYISLPKKNTAPENPAKLIEIQ